MTCQHTHYVDVSNGVRECIDCGARIGVVVIPELDQAGLWPKPPGSEMETVTYWLHRYVHLQSGEIVEDDKAVTGHARSELTDAGRKWDDDQRRLIEEARPRRQDALYDRLVNGKWAEDPTE